MNRAGAELRTLDVMRGLRERGILFDYCALTGMKGDLDGEIAEAGGHVFPIGLGIRFPTRFIRLLHERTYDAVHSHVHYFSGYVLRLAARAGIRHRIAHFRSSRDGHRRSLGRQLQNWLMKRWIHKYATRIIGVSKHALSEAWSRDWQSDARCSVIHNGIDLAHFRQPATKAEVFKEFSFPADSILWIHLGRLDEAKNHPRLLNLFAAFLRKRPNARLLLVGREGKAAQAIDRLAAKLGINGHVHKAGVRSDTARLLAAAHLMIYPSLWEGLPGAVIEALAVGVPVVASDIGSIREIAELCPRLRLVSLDESDDVWLDCIDRALTAGAESDPAVRLKDLEAFSLKKSVDMFADLYSEFDRASLKPSTGLQPEDRTES